MRILGFESSAVSASVAYCKDGVLIASTFQSAGLTHSATLLPMAEALLRNAGFTLPDVDLLAVAHGPGSFTGLRIGISLVKGLAFAQDIPCVGVSTLEALAYNLPRQDAVLCAVMDARAGQVYSASFDLSGGVPARLCPDRAIAAEALRRELAAVEKPLWIAGDGAHLLEGAGQVVWENLRLQNAYGVCRLAEKMYKVESNFTLATLRPVYLRLPQAERERLERLERSGDK